MFNDICDTIPSPPPAETIPPDTIPNNPLPEITEIDNQIPEEPETKAKSTAVTITPSTVNVPLIMVLTTIVAVLISMFYCCH